MTHPNSLELEALACGESNDAAEHVAACDECSAWVERAKALPPPKALHAPRPSHLRWISTAALPLAAAAALFFLVRRPPPAPVGDAMPKAEYSTSFKGSMQI